MDNQISRSDIADILRGHSIDTEVDVQYVADLVCKRISRVDAVPVVHAKWGEAEIVGYDGIRVIYGFPCGRCGRHVRHIGCGWCPWCGAKMDATSNVPEKNVGELGGVINAVD